MAVGVLIALCGCSHVSQLSSAERKESSAIVQADKQEGAILARAGDYNREIAYALSKPDVRAVPAAEEILQLQYNLTGPGSMQEKARDAFVDKLIADNASARSALASATSEDSTLHKRLTDAEAERDKAVADEHDLAAADAAQADKLDHLWNVVYLVIALLVIGIVLYILEKLGVFAATMAAKVP
jgi:hypothetical protein